MASYMVNIPVTVTYTFCVEREEGLTKEELLKSITDDELNDGEMEQVGWGEVKYFFLKGEVDAQDEEGNDL